MLKLASLLTLALLSSAHSQCFSKDDSTKKVSPQVDRQALYRGQLEFTLNMFNRVNSQYPDDNIFFSPFSVYHSLLLAYLTSAGYTERELKKSLMIDDSLDKMGIVTSYRLDRHARRTNNNSQSYEFSSANKVFADEGLEVRDCMKQLLIEELETLKFHSDPETARQYINMWVEKITKNNIKELLSADAVDSTTKLVLANAAYFKGLWASKFVSERTKKEAFFVSETRQTLVPFMKQKGNFHYMVNEDLGAQILELPYKGNDISMYILLPPYSMKEGVSNIIANLTPERLAAVVEEDYNEREVVVEIPKFTMERSLPLRGVLEQMGAGELFNATADFSTLTPNAGVKFNDAIHKAKIQLDEEGTVAAAATAIFVFRSSRPVEPTRFVANFPFVYLIYEKPTKSVLFMGVYRDPKK